MILVTGAAGLTGSIVIREFAHRGLPVRALVRQSAQAAQFDALPTVDVVTGDMLAPKTLSAALDGVERALMISTAGVQMMDTQCTFIEAAKSAGVQHIVKIAGIDSGIGFDPYAFRAGRWHAHVERYLEGCGIAWTHIRPVQFMQFYLPSTVTGVDPIRRELVMPIGESELSPVDIEDIAKVAVALLHSPGHEGKRYFMTGPEALTMNQVVDQISQATGAPFKYRAVSLEEKRRQLAAAGLPDDALDLIDELFSERARCTKSYVDLSTHETFGVEPTSFAQFARRHAAEFLAA
ncbi:NmrA family NAD(P)-binding protein [Mycobacterium sp. 1165178.9]|uniref:NmrA family NAD(P)-binding protein n=1 Tax=Mycobacterium sp. 1165178.9 TaxID=1834070 RepID=UPI000802528E|nr:NmrA family NAD(P)-binding protein [Mycobacterium sp. 1165178.9]OBK70073.1 NAD(P)-dependent oxidoreductase [Mycobacterium sp. 1165178.9]